MQPLHALAASTSGDDFLPPGAMAALRFFADLIPDLPPHEINLLTPFRRPSLIWSDGAWEPEQEHPGMVGFLVATPKPEFESNPLPADASHAVLSEYNFCHGSAEVPAELVEALVCRNQQIGQIEILGALVPYLSVPQTLAGREVIHWIDNTSALSALTKGYSGVPDSARLVHLFHAWNAGARARTWFEYVPTDANPADKPSRQNLAGRVWRVVPGVKSTPVDLQFPQIDKWADAAGWAREASRICSP